MNFLVSLTTLSLVEIDGNPIKHECPYSLFYEQEAWMPIMEMDQWVEVI